MIEGRYECRVEVQQAPDVNLFTNPTAQVSLAGWTSVGLTSFVQQASGQPSPPGTAFRLNGSAAASDSYMVGSGSGIQHGMETGVQYTVSGSLNLGGSLAGTANTYARRIVVFHRIGAAAYTAVQSAQAPNSAGNTRLSVAFTLPAGTTEAFIRFYHGHAGTSTAFWHSLRLTPGTQTDYLDGSMTDGFGFDDLEYGWDGPAGLSTSWRVDRSQNVTLPEAVFREISYDNLRVPVIQATIEAPWPADETWPLIEPRRARDVILNWSVVHYQRGSSGDLDEVVSSLPLGWPVGTAGKLWLRDLIVDYIGHAITLRASSGEVRFEDKKRIAGNTLDTGATTVQALWDYALVDVGEVAARGVSGSGPAATPVPAGDRRLWLQGESASALFEAELAAIGYRSYCDDIGRFSADEFESPPFPGTGATFTLMTGDDGTIIRATQTRSRDQWRDATLIRAQYVDGAGAQQTAYQRYPSTGANRKGEVDTIDRAIPSTTYAEYVNRRALFRGAVFDIEALLDFRACLGRHISLPGFISGGSPAPDRVTYRPGEGTMTVIVSTG